MKNRAVVLSILMASAVSLFGQQASVREEQQVFKTYPFSGADPSPIMTRSSIWGRGQRLYPYFSFDNLSYTAADQNWNVVVMENPYIKVLIMPAEGGKLIGAIEKSTGKEFIYLNHARKFRHIALRGPWTSGGIELNFGIVGHTPATATPVDYLIQKNADGGVSCIVGTMDLPSRTHWRVRFTVPPDKAYVEVQSLWYNPQPLNQSYYVWMNAANKLSNDLEFIFPGTMHIGHDYSVESRPWPVTVDGRNLALYKEHNDSDEGSFFVHGKLSEFSGAYWHDAQFGFGHWAVHEEVPGQKFFRWPLSRSGAIWEKLLTDDDGPYFEPQNGRLLDQNDHEFFAPYTTDQWRELYFPYKKTGPMVKATPYGALNARTEDGALVLRFCALQRIDETLLVRDRGREVFRDRVTLGPMQVYEKRVPIAVKKGDLRVDLGDKLTYTDDPNDELLKRPQHFRNYDETTLEGLYQSAEREEKARDYDLALEKYLLCLKREPLHMRALTRVAELYYRRAEYGTALEYARKALDYVMYDPDANFIYGVISKRLDNLVDAKETLGWAARSMKYRASAYGELGAIYLMESNFERALTYLKRALDYDSSNIRTLQLLATAYRTAGQSPQARQTLSKILEIDPLNHQARFERYLLGSDPAALADFKALIRNELPHETYLEIAVYYANLRRTGDALRVLEAAPEQATLRYWQAYLLRETSPQRSRDALNRAAALSPYLVFPFREESIPVFEWAARLQPADWKAKYYLGLIYWGLRRNADALQAFQSCGDQPDYAPAYISRAYLERQADPAKALLDYERAHQIGKSDWRNWYHLASYYGVRGMHDKALTLVREAATLFPREDLIRILLARAYLNSGRYQDCYAQLESSTILPFEGQRDVHLLFVQCQLALAIEELKKGRYAKAMERVQGSREYPERLGTGKPHNPDYRVQDALEMLCHGGAGDTANADQAWARVEAYRGSSATRASVEQWRRETLPAQPASGALRQLSEILGRRRRR
jgi:tetratricopeptide (TPR) repeat protein